MRAAANAYRAKAFECLSLAECMNDPENRAEILRYARIWMPKRWRRSVGRRGSGRRGDGVVQKRHSDNELRSVDSPQCGKVPTRLEGRDLSGGQIRRRIDERSFDDLSVRHQPIILAAGMHYSTPSPHGVCGTLGAMVLQQ